MLDVVDECFDGVLIFRDGRWTSLGEDGVFELGEVSLEYSPPMILDFLYWYLVQPQPVPVPPS